METGLKHEPVNVAAQELGISKQRVHKLIACGLLVAVRSGGHVLVSRTSLNALIALRKARQGRMDI